ncbi:glycosyltransferase family 4 protein [Listeria booriae]|nr:glycosyltransferase family 4 protein [Listeria booriae]
MMQKVYNISSVHPWSDTRIFFREASSISVNPKYEVVHIAVANGVNTHINTPIDIQLIPKRTKLQRYKNWRILWREIKIGKPNIVHFHDPELLLLAWFIRKRLNLTLIYDMHENVPQVVGSKQSIPKSWRKVAKWLYQKIEKWLMRSCDGVIFAEEHYKLNYRFLTCPTVDIYNYPAISSSEESLPKQECFTFVYIGSISELRGAGLMIDMAEQLAKHCTDFQIRVIGTGFEAFQAEADFRGVSKWIHFEGAMPFDKAFEVLQTAHVGLSLLKRHPNFLGCKPTKCMEYMAAGVPFMVSNFLMQEDLKRYPCGVSVDTADIDSIVDAALYLLDNRTVVKEMGLVGKRAYQETYSWKTEEAKLIQFYSELEEVSH